MNRTPTAERGAQLAPVAWWGGVDRLRLRGAALPEVDAQDHEGADGQELGLPVLERLEPEVGGPHERRRRHGRAAVRLLLLAVLVGTADQVEHEAHGEQDEEGEAQ